MSAYKIQIIIFSYNRAIQLDRLLLSLYDNWKYPDYQIDVVYNSSSESFEKGYDILKQKYLHKNIVFHKEKDNHSGPKLSEICNFYNFKRLLKYKYLWQPKTDFRDILLNLLQTSSCNYIMFLTDDSQFIRNVNISEDTFIWLNQETNNRQYSLRIGKNMDDFPKELVKENRNSLFWNFYDCSHHTNWGFTFSVDAHIYSKDVIYYLFKKLLFCNPNTLEGFVQNYVYKSRLLGQGKSDIKPAILSFPINMVQDFNVNESLSVSSQMLNEYYLQGYTLDYPYPNNPIRFQQYPSELFLKRKEEIITMKTHE